MSTPQALDGMRVLDLTSGDAGPYTTKLLADFGADVVKVEPPGGDRARAEPPFFRGQPHPDGSARFLFLNTNKRSVVADLAAPEGAALTRELAVRSDVVIEDFAPGRLGELGLGYEELDRLRPGIVFVSITPWGQTGGPYASYSQTDIVAQAMGGRMLWTGSAQREPLKHARDFAQLQAGAVAALATMVACHRQETTGVGDWVDIAVYETQAGSRDAVTPNLTAYSYCGAEPLRLADAVTMATGVRPCKDGFVNILGIGGIGRLDAFLRMIGRDDLVGDERLAVNALLIEPALVEDVESSYLAWLMQRTKREAVAEAQAHRLLAGAINTPADLLADSHFRERGVWETVDHPHTGPIEYAGRPFRMSATPRRPARRAPLLDEHAAEMQRELAAERRSGSGVARVSERTSGEAGRELPLSGVRVVDITVVWAGPYCTQLLAEWGAEVIRVEPVTRIQPMTRGAERRVTREQAQRLAAQGLVGAAGFPDFEPRDRPWDRNAGFNSHARNKLSATTDVSTPEGRALFYRLIEQADVFVENNVPETIEKAQITYEELRRVNPELVMLRMPGFGLDGPYKNYRSLGLHVDGAVAHHHLRGYPDALPSEAGNIVASDAIAGIQGAFAVLMALRHHRRSGEGQQIELAQAENFLPMIGEQLLDWTMNAHDPGPQGNWHHSRAPHQAYPCQGDDQWIAIDAEGDEQFAALCAVLPAPALARDPRFQDAAGRWERRAELDDHMAERTRGWDKFELFHALQAAGVAAGPLLTAAERFACPQLEHRGFFETLENSVVGRHRYPGIMWKMARTPNELQRAPAGLGQDNEYVWRQIAGLSDEEYAHHLASGMIGDTYPDAVLGYTPGQSP